ncbi:MAG TPA: TrmH family RNA methyltransferase [Anaerolineales bacterium]|nr:TrmH family RNA methyltransferase [Anaerolineales bacterium]
MPEGTYEIRICESCGLRYPLVVGQRFGTRCPVCMGETRIVLSRELVTEPAPPLRPAPFDYADTPAGLPKRGGMAVLLDNIRSAWNVGSILRSADGFGFSQAYLCGITSTPENEAVTRTSLGAEDSVPWSYHKDAVKLVQGLKKEGFHIEALEDHERAMDIRLAASHGNFSKQQTNKSVLVVGNEITGVDPQLIDLCDRIFHIQMLGEKRSFNVAIAFSIAAFALAEK